MSNIIEGFVDFEDVAAVRRLISYAKARHVLRRLLVVIHDYELQYDSLGTVLIHNDAELHDQLTTEIQVALDGLDRV